MNITILEKGDLSTDIVYRDKTLSVDSEIQGTKLFVKVTSEKQIISIRTKESVCTLEDAIREHRNIVEHIKRIIMAENLGEYIKKIPELLERKNFSDAILLLREVRFFHPSDPYLMCLDGYLTALVEKRYRDGINLCNQAIAIYSKKAGIGKEFFLPFFYIYLGRTYLLSGNKRLAVDTFYKILRIDSENREAIRELSNLGIRQRPVIPFLKRSNPINKYLGILRAKLSGKNR
ncbi:MAG: hypothetical protein N2257_01445 [Thermodesulfovibrionales bacterium]|nr:hypothetical protein [Thermodesulfovibrionales bacterium]